MLTRLTSDVCDCRLLGAGIITIVLDFLMIFGCLTAMIYFDPVLTLLLLLCSPVLLVLDLDTLNKAQGSVSIYP